jgi:hypothetical protein
MESPSKMISKLTESDSEMKIETPKKKSWVLIIVFSLITLQFTNGIIQSLFFANDLPISARLIILLISLTVVYFVLTRGLMWQLKGIKKIVVNDSTLKCSKLSTLWTNEKEYKLSEIRSIEIKDESISEGPLAMLQLLGITDKIKINMIYGYKTDTLISGIDNSEAVELKSKLIKILNIK